MTGKHLESTWKTLLSGRKRVQVKESASTAFTNDAEMEVDLQECRVIGQIASDDAEKDHVR